MQIEKITHWISLLGNLGLLVGIGLVVVQMNQNEALVREQLYHASWTDDLNMHLALMGENPAAAVAKAIEDPANLTVEEARVLDAYVTYWSLNETRRLLMAERGMTIDPLPTYEPGSPRFGLDMQVMGNAYAKARSEVVGLGPGLIPHVEPLTSVLSGNESYERYQQTIRLINEKAEALNP